MNDIINKSINITLFILHVQCLTSNPDIVEYIHMQSLCILGLQ